MLPLKVYSHQRMGHAKQPTVGFFLRGITLSLSLGIHAAREQNFFFLAQPNFFVPRALGLGCPAGPRLALMASVAGLGVVGVAYAVDKTAASVLGQGVIF